MKKSLVVTALGFILLIIVSFQCFGQENREWKGKIEEENNTKIIINPVESIYGEIKLDLAEDLRIGKESDENYFMYRIRGMDVDAEGNIYVADMSNHRIQVFDRTGAYQKTIGRQGQGPGEFEMPTDIRINRWNGIICVKDRVRSIETFNKKGEFIKSIKLSSAVQDFFPVDDNVFYLILRRSSNEELKSVNAMVKINDIGEEIRKFGEFPFPIYMKKRGGGTLVMSSGYETALFINLIDQNKILYGYSKDYELNVLDINGDMLFKIRKEADIPKFTPQEKAKFKKIPLPEDKPYFFSLLSDSKNRIYVQRNKSEEGIRGYGPLDVEEKQMDVFSEEGYFLFTTKLPANTWVIRDGFIYAHTLDEEQGMEYVIRYKINNWDQLKTK